MLVSGMASTDMTRLCEVREVFKMMGINDWMAIQTESVTVVKHFNRQIDDTVGDASIFKDLVNIKSEDCIGVDQMKNSEHSNIEVIVKIENQNQSGGLSNQVCVKLEKSNNQTCHVEPLKSNIPVQKTRERIASMKHAANLEEKGAGNTIVKVNGVKSKKKTFSRNISQKKFSCPHCEKKLLTRQNMANHTAKCPPLQQDSKLSRFFDKAY